MPQVSDLAAFFCFSFHVLKGLKGLNHGKYRKGFEIIPSHPHALNLP